MHLNVPLSYLEGERGISIIYVHVFFFRISHKSFIGLIHNPLVLMSNKLSCKHMCTLLINMKLCENVFNFFVDTVEQCFIQIILI